jgi:hypothetical protein
MRSLFRLSVLVLAAPLAGCYGLTAPKEVPPWAMATGVGHAERATPVRRAARPQVITRQSAADGPAVVTGSVPTPSYASNAPTAYTPEWFAQEHAADERLRQQMNICRGC